MDKNLHSEMNYIQKWFQSIDWNNFWNHFIIISLRLLLLLVLYFILKAIGIKIIRGFFKQYRQNKAVSPARASTLESLISNFYGYVLFFTFVILFLQNFIDVTALIAGAGVVSFAIAFGAQGLVSDVVTGFFVLLERQIDVGDAITLEGINGTVESLGLRTTQVRDYDGTLHFIPNRKIMIVSNHSRGNMRVLVDVLINSQANIEKALSVIQSVADKTSHANKNVVGNLEVLGVQTMDATGISIRVVGEAINGEQLTVQRDFLKDAQEALTKNNIDFPPPVILPINEQNS